MRRAFTLIELMVVIGAMGLLFSLTMPALLGFRGNSDLENSREGAVQALRRAQVETLASKGDSQWGVYFATSTLPHRYTLFQGPSYASRTVSSDVVFEVPRRIEIFQMGLAGGGQEVVFGRVVGTTTQPGLIGFRVISNPARTVVISIDASGRVSSGAEVSGTTIDFTGGATNADLASFPNNSGFGDPAQSFTTGAAVMSVSRVELQIRRTTNDPSDTHLEIRSGSTVGAVLGMSQIIDGAALPSTLGWVAYNFAAPVALAADTQYFLRFRSNPVSTAAFSGAAGTIYWAYIHSGSSPPAYAGGDAWRYIGANSCGSCQGQRLGPADQYDFNFRVISGTITAPSLVDSRHVHTAYSRIIATATENIVLSFDGGTVQTTVPIASNMTGGEIDWTGTAIVGGEAQTIRIRTHRLNNSDTLFSIHRDRRYNTKSVTLRLSGDGSGTFLEYSADGLTTIKTSVYAGTPEWR